MRKLKYVQLFENFRVNEKTFFGGVDPSDIYSYLRNKDYEKYKKIQNSDLKDIYLSDLLETPEGRELMGNYFEGFVKLLKDLNLKINLEKSKIDHPRVLLDVYNNLVKNKLLSLEDLIDANAFKNVDFNSEPWTRNVLNKIDKTNTNDLFTIVEIIKGKVKK
jgi:hypothetical protein